MGTNSVSYRRTDYNDEPPRYPGNGAIHRLELVIVAISQLISTHVNGNSLRWDEELVGTVSSSNSWPFTAGSGLNAKYNGRPGLPARGE
jgi:hypothetical protein